MLTMQASDGGVFHKLTTLLFPGDIMPNEDTETRYVIGKGTAATFDFAAVMAVAARVYNTANPSFAAQCLEAAKKAYSWGLQNPNVRFTNPSDVKTGEYGDSHFDDEKSFAAAELYVTTGDASYKISGASANIPNWTDVGGLATYEKAINQTHFGTEGVDSLLKVAYVLESRSNSGFGVVMGGNDFVWGSNAVAANQGIWLLHAYYITGDEKYYTAAVKVLDYLLGKNPLNMSFVTGYGTKTAKNPHHRPSTADNISEPIPGMVVGGPQPGGEDIGSETWECSDYRTGKPATSYIDNHCSYATNEVAINWNAPFVYLAGAIEAINAGFKPDFAVFNPKNSLPQVRGFAAQPSNGPKLIFDGHRLLMKHNGKQYNLKGVR
jgi:endoglucanase